MNVHKFLEVYFRGVSTSGTIYLTGKANPTLPSPYPLPLPPLAPYYFPPFPFLPFFSNRRPKHIPRPLTYSLATNLYR